MKECCPDCVVELKKNKRKLGIGSTNNWLVCPKCGYRTRLDSAWEKLKVLTEFVNTVVKKRIDELNKEENEY